MDSQTVWSRIVFVLFVLFPLFSNGEQPGGMPDERPNLLWLTTEDIGLQLGCYGDDVAVTPHLDRLASKGLTYDFAWSNYPVCAPARTTIITGMYASAHSAGHMRCQRRLPAEIKMFPQYLRDAGYFCTNRSKEDYNLVKPGKVWDQSNRKADYRNRQPGQPFFAVVNQTVTHESRIRKRPHTQITPPDAIRVPPYHPDTPEVRRDWAQYYDNIRTMDDWVGKQLSRLEQDGLADDTIVVFFGDHGSGMPRHKRYVGSSGMRIPLIVYVPPKWQHLAPKDYVAGGRSSRLVSFVDLAPSMLSLAGQIPPVTMQGTSFLGHRIDPAPRFVRGFRNRMDERVDYSRSLSDGRYLYVCNLMPHLPHGQYLSYQQQTPTTRVWNDMFRAGKLNAVQARFWQSRSFEELYDLEADPDETKNLLLETDSKIPPEILALRDQFRSELRQSRLDGDLIPESLSMRFSSEQSGWDVVRDDDFDELVDVAMTAANSKLPGSLEQCLNWAELEGDDVWTLTRKHWGATGLLIRSANARRSYPQRIRELLSDEMPTVRIQVAELLSGTGSKSERKEALKVLLDAADMEKTDYYSAIWALNALDRRMTDTKEILSNIRPQIKALPRKPKNVSRAADYVERLILDFGKQSGESIR